MHNTRIASISPTRNLSAYLAPSRHAGHGPGPCLAAGIPAGAASGPSPGVGAHGLSAPQGLGAFGLGGAPSGATTPSPYGGATSGAMTPSPYPLTTVIRQVSPRLQEPSASARQSWVPFATARSVVQSPQASPWLQSRDVASHQPAIFQASSKELPSAPTNKTPPAMERSPGRRSQPTGDAAASMSSSPAAKEVKDLIVRTVESYTARSTSATAVPVTVTAAPAVVTAVTAPAAAAPAVVTVLGSSCSSSTVGVGDTTQPLAHSAQMEQTPRQASYASQRLDPVTAKFKFFSQALSGSHTPVAATPREVRAAPSSPTRAVSSAGPRPQHSQSVPQLFCGLENNALGNSSQLSVAVQELSSQLANYHQQNQVLMRQLAAQQKEPPSSPAPGSTATLDVYSPSRQARCLVERTPSWSGDSEGVPPSCRLGEKTVMTLDESTALPEMPSTHDVVRFQSTGNSAGDDARGDEELTAQLRYTISQLQQRNASLEDALNATLVRSATMEADNAELREFVGSLVERIASLESQLAARSRAASPTPRAAATTPQGNGMVAAHPSGPAPQRVVQQPRGRGKVPNGVGLRANR